MDCFDNVERKRLNDHSHQFEVFPWDTTPHKINYLFQWLILNMWVVSYKISYKKHTLW